MYTCRDFTKLLHITRNYIYNNNVIGLFGLGLGTSTSRLHLRSRD